MPRRECPRRHCKPPGKHDDDRHLEADRLAARGARHELAETTNNTKANSGGNSDSKMLRDITARIAKFETKESTQNNDRQSTQAAPNL